LVNGVSTHDIRGRAVGPTAEFLGGDGVRNGVGLWLGPTRLCLAQGQATLHAGS
jgi:hypothetical protein